MSRRRGSVRQRSRGSWLVSFRAGRGVRISETVRGTKTKAEQRLTEMLREYDTTGLVPDREATVSSFSVQWLEHVAHRIKPVKYKRYRELLEVHVVPVIGQVRMTDLRPAAVQAVMTKVLASRSPRTAVNTYRVLSEMLDEAARWGMIATNPAAAIRPPRTPRLDLHVPDAATCTAILERSRDRQVEGPVVLALGTGMRLGEILAARWKDVDLERKGAPRHRDAVLRRRRVHLPAAEDVSRTPLGGSTSVRRHVPEELAEGSSPLSRCASETCGWTTASSFRTRSASHSLRGLDRLPPARARVGTTQDAVSRLAARPREAVALRRRTPEAVCERLGHSSIAFTMDTYSAVIPSLGRAAADAADQLFG